MKFPQILPPTDHAIEVGLLGFVAAVVAGICALGVWRASQAHPFDPSAYLVVLTLIVGAIKERWQGRSIDRMGQSLANAPPAAPPAPEPEA